MPPGNCFQDAVHAFDDEMFSDWALAHGIVINSGTHAGQAMSHAWLEKDHLVYDAPSDQFVPKEMYYRIGQIEYVVQYTVTEMREMVVKHEHYGPWDEHILKESIGNNR